MNNLDIDQILSEEESFPCKLLISNSSLNHFDAKNDEILKEGSRIDLPLWLADALSKKGIVEIEIPKHFGPKVRDELSSSSTLNLRDFSHYFFEIGLNFGRIKKDDDLIRTMRMTFCGDRFNKLLAHSLSSYHDDITEYSHSLTNMELSILNQGIITSKDLYRWRQRDSHILQAAPILGKRIMINSNINSKRTREG